MDLNLQEKFVHHMEVARAYLYDVQSEDLHNSIRVGYHLILLNTCIFLSHMNFWIIDT